MTMRRKTKLINLCIYAITTNAEIGLQIWAGYRWGIIQIIQIIIIKQPRLLRQSGPALFTYVVFFVSMVV